MKEKLLNLIAKHILKDMDTSEIMQEVTKKIDLPNLAKQVEKEVIDDVSKYLKLKLRKEIEETDFEKQVKKHIQIKEWKDFITPKKVSEVGFEYAKVYIDEKAKELARYNWSFGNEKFSISKYVQEVIQDMIKKDIIDN